jgi:hypothetical protein
MKTIEKFYILFIFMANVSCKQGGQEYGLGRTVKKKILPV